MTAGLFWVSALGIVPCSTKSTPCTLYIVRSDETVHSLFYTTKSWDIQYKQHKTVCVRSDYYSCHVTLQMD